MKFQITSAYFFLLIALIDIDEKDAKRITTVAVEAVCLLTDVGWHR